MAYTPTALPGLLGGVLAHALEVGELLDEGGGRARVHVLDEAAQRGRSHAFLGLDGRGDLGLDGGAQRRRARVVEDLGGRQVRAEAAQRILVAPGGVVVGRAVARRIVGRAVRAHAV